MEREQDKGGKENFLSKFWQRLNEPTIPMPLALRTKLALKIAQTAFTHPLKTSYFYIDREK